MFGPFGGIHPHLLFQRRAFSFLLCVCVVTILYLSRGCGGSFAGLFVSNTGYLRGWAVHSWLGVLSLLPKSMWRSWSVGMRVSSRFGRVKVELVLKVRKDWGWF